MIQNRLAKLRNAMKAAEISCYIIPTSDYHNSEYVSEHFCVRKYFSCFTGSAGVLVVFADKAALFTDGRYFIQAEAQLSGSSITLMKIGESGVPKLNDYIEQELGENENIGFDGRVITADEGAAYEKIAAEKHGRVIYSLDLADKIWLDRPPLPATEAYILQKKYCGENTESKLSRLREKMKLYSADAHILTTLDDIAWLFNLRANDVECCPVLLSFAVITLDKAYLFANECAFSAEIKAYLSENNVILKPYGSFYEFAEEYCSLNKESKILICKSQINYRLQKAIEAHTAVTDKPNPTALMKAIKNKTEQDNLRKAHLYDGIAVTKFMYWLKKNVGKIPMTEASAGEYLEELRRKNPSFIEPSFETICGYGSNGAIIHYIAEKENCADILPKGMLMVDSGGHYYEGSTDITRTFVLGDITDKMKKDYTLVLRAMLRLKSQRFLYGCKGENLELAAREVFWEKGLNYNHGTGHGVGYLLNVHEGPNSFNFRASASNSEDRIFEEGMVTTDEPGMYIEGSHGVRIENELLCRRGVKNEYGQFMYFEDLTYAPIDLDGVDLSAMEEKEIILLNEYHQLVYEKLSPFFEGEELAWLKSATRELLPDGR